MTLSPFSSWYSHAWIVRIPRIKLEKISDEGIFNFSLWGSILGILYNSCPHCMNADISFSMPKATNLCSKLHTCWWWMVACGTWKLYSISRYFSLQIYVQNCKLRYVLSVPYHSWLVLSRPWAEPILGGDRGITFPTILWDCKPEDSIVFALELLSSIFK